MPADLQGFVERFGGVFEHSAWVAERAWNRRPFDSVLQLHAVMLQVVADATPAEQLELLCAHPELAGVQAMQGSLTAESSGEQGRLGFTALDQAAFERIADINRRYREKFGFPCIVALRLHAGRDSVMAEMERRLAHDTQTELRIALEQVGHITQGRLAMLLGEE